MTLPHWAKQKPLRVRGLCRAASKGGARITTGPARHTESRWRTTKWCSSKQNYCICCIIRAIIIYLQNNSNIFFFRSETNELKVNFCMEKWNIKLELGQFEIQYGGQYLTTISGNWYHWIPCPKKHTFRYQNQVNSCIMSRRNSKCRFQVAAILKSNMADIKREFQVA